MSGGVDSSVAALLMKKKGYEVIGAFMKNWSHEKHGMGECTWKSERKVAMKIAAQLNIPLITFDFEKQYQNHQEAIKAYGKQVGRKYIQRINIIKSATDVNELCILPGLRCHPLKGDRAGQWALKLTGYFRLIFTVEGKKLEIACIEEVSKHYEN